MSDLQDKLNQILQNPEAMKQVQSLGAQLGLTGEQKQPPKPKPPENNLMSVLGGDDTIGTIAKFAPFVNGNNINEIFQELSDAIYHIERNGNAKIILTDLSIKLTRLIHKK